MKTVTFTQYMRPSGRQVTVTHETSDEVADLAEDMVLTCEVLMSGEVTLYGRLKDEEEEEWLEIVPNGPGVPAAVEKLIRHVERRRLNAYEKSDEQSLREAHLNERQTDG